VTAVLLGLLFHLGHGRRGRADFEGARTLLSHQFARLWDRPAARSELAAEIARDFGLQVEVLDASRNVLSVTGGACKSGRIELSVSDDAGLLGHVRACSDRSWWPPFWVPLGIAVLALWAGSGLIARQVARPLGSLASMADDIGRGRLASRVHFHGRTYDEVHLVGEVMNDMAARIEKQLADQRALLATVSHELRTPLSRMRLLIEMARTASPNQDDAQRRKLDELEKEVAEVDALVGDLLASSRVDFSVLRPARLDAVPVARDVLDRAGLEPGRLVTAEKEAFFEADATLIVRALANLVSNAELHGGGLCALRIEVRPGFVAFLVEDRGEGFVPGDEARVFEPFFKRGTTGSVGLGLTLVRRIAEAHGGRAWAENRPNGGALVAIEVASQR
jgi:signal transduction histidine kinase